MKSERLEKIFQNAPYETRLMIALMEEIVGKDAVEKVLENMEQSSPSLNQIKIGGRPLRQLSGLSDEQLDKMLTPEEKEEYYSYFERPLVPNRHVAKYTPEEEPKVEEPEGPKEETASSKKSGAK